MAVSSASVQPGRNLSCSSMIRVCTLSIHEALCFKTSNSDPSISIFNTSIRLALKSDKMSAIPTAGMPSPEALSSTRKLHVGTLVSSIRRWVFLLHSPACNGRILGKSFVFFSRVAKLVGSGSSATTVAFGYLLAKNTGRQADVRTSIHNEFGVAQINVVFV